MRHNIQMSPMSTTIKSDQNSGEKNSGWLLYAETVEPELGTMTVETAERTTPYMLQEHCNEICDSAISRPTLLTPQFLCILCPIATKPPMASGNSPGHLVPSFFTSGCHTNPPCFIQVSYREELRNLSSSLERQVALTWGRKHAENTCNSIALPHM